MQQPFPCPTCRQEMEERFAKTRDPARPAPVRQCQSCWGVFVNERAQEALLLTNKVRGLEATETGGRRCPTCEREMKLLKLPARRAFFKKVELDRCPACTGLFFDPGELQEALGRVASIAASRDDEYLKKNPRRVSSQMGDPAGPWHARNRGFGPSHRYHYDDEPTDLLAMLYDLLHPNED